MWKRLFTPIKIGHLELKNRILMSPLATIFADENGAVTDRLIRFHAARARGGAALQIVEAADVTGDPEAVGRLGIRDDQLIPGLGDLAEAIKDAGGRPAIQLAIRASQHKGADGPNGLSPVEIHALANAFALAAGRAQAAGFEAVEVHSAHLTLLAQFLSPLTNRRRDEYGSSLEGRTHFLCEILHAMRKTVGHDFPIFLRLNGDEFAEGGLRIHDTIAIAQKVESLIAVLHVSAGGPGTFYWTTGPMALPRGHLVHLAHAAKLALKIPVITVGRINDPVLADNILAEGKADLVAMGRPLIADPDLPRKAAAGACEDIRPCIACNYCRDRVTHDLRLRCTVNPCAGREGRFQIFPAAKPKKVLVVGGGPAGLEAALVAKMRGHDVSLWEKDIALGGQMGLASIPPNKEEIKGYGDYLSRQVRKSGVSITLGREVTPDIVSGTQPDVVVLATGGTPLIPDIQGIALAMASGKVIAAEDALRNSPDLGQQVVVLGGASVGCETAEFLAQRGHQVTIVEKLPRIAHNVEERTRFFLLERLNKLGVRILTGADVKQVSDGAILALTRDGKEQTITMDYVVLATGYQPNKILTDALTGGPIPVFAVGDCVQPRNMASAIYEGARVGREL